MTIAVFPGRVFRWRRDFLTRVQDGRKSWENACVALADGNTCRVNRLLDDRGAITGIRVFFTVPPGISPAGAIAGDGIARKWLDWLDGSWLDCLPDLGAVKKS